MLSDKLVTFLKEQAFWYEEEDTNYKEAFSKLDLDLESDFTQFYLHAEDGPYFSSSSWDLYHLGWFLRNTDLSEDLYSINETLALSNDYIGLDSFEGEAGYFYHKKTQEVFLFKLGLSYEEREVQKWDNFVVFLEWYFEL